MGVVSGGDSACRRLPVQRAVGCARFVRRRGRPRGLQVSYRAMGRHPEGLILSISYFPSQPELFLSPKSTETNRVSARKCSRQAEKWTDVSYHTSRMPWTAQWSIISHPMATHNACALQRRVTSATTTNRFLGGCYPSPRPALAAAPPSTHSYRGCRDGEGSWSHHGSGATTAISRLRATTPECSNVTCRGRRVR